MCPVTREVAMEWSQSTRAPRGWDEAPKCVAFLGTADSSPRGLTPRNGSLYRSIGLDMRASAAMSGS